MPEETPEGPVIPLRPDDVLDKLVYDVNGRLLGHVSLAREVNEQMLSFDVELSPKAQRAFHARHPVATVPADLVVDSENEISLNEDGLYLVHPELTPPAMVPGE